MKSVNIITCQGDKPVYLGLVEYVGLQEDHIEYLVAASWKEFQKTFPDSDSQFIDFLVARSFQKVPQENILTVTV